MFKLLSRTVERAWRVGCASNSPPRSHLMNHERVAELAGRAVLERDVTVLCSPPPALGDRRDHFPLMFSQVREELVESHSPSCPMSQLLLTTGPKCASRDQMWDLQEGPGLGTPPQRPSRKDCDHKKKGRWRDVIGMVVVEEAQEASKRGSSFKEGNVARGPGRVWEAKVLGRALDIPCARKV